MKWVFIVATVGSITLVGAPVRAQVVTREMPMPPIGESLLPAAAAAAATATATVAAAAVDDFTEAREQYRAAASSHDAATLVDLFAEDGVLVASDHDVIRGRQDIGKYLANAGGQGMPEVTLTCISAESRNGFGSETGRFEERVTSSEGAVTRVTGVYVVIYRRDEAGRWRVAIEIRSRGDQQPLGLW
jgi:ketosteroid isomerase-like protein